MDPGTVALLHSPIVGVESWGTLPDALRQGGLAVLAVRVDGDDRPPYAERYVERAAAAVLAAVPRPARPLVLVGHSGAGPLLPAVGAALRAGGLPPGGYLFCDAGLPPGEEAEGPEAGRPPGGGPAGREAGRPPGRGADRLDLLAVEDAAMAAGFRAELAAGGRFPGWTDRDLEPLVPDPADRQPGRGALPRPGRPRRAGRRAAGAAGADGGPGRLGLQAGERLADPLGDAAAVQAELGEQQLALAVGQELVGDAQPQQRRADLLVGQHLRDRGAEAARQHVVLHGHHQPVRAGDRGEPRVQRLHPARVDQRDADPVPPEQPRRLLAVDRQLAEPQQQHVL